MKIILIRHAAPDFVWEKNYTSAGFAEACAAYDAAGIKDFAPDPFDVTGKAVYVSTLRRAKETASLLFPGADLQETDLLNEVPLSPSGESSTPRALSYWQSKGRLQWFLNDPRQKEGRKETIRRAEAAIDLIEKETKDVVLVSHGFFLTILLKRLRKRGYVLARGGFGKIDYLERIRATRRVDHCGACNHNCTLKNPGCGVGMDKARREGITA